MLPKCCCTTWCIDPAAPDDSSFYSESCHVVEFSALPTASATALRWGVLVAVSWWPTGCAALEPKQLQPSSEGRKSGGHYDGLVLLRCKPPGETCRGREAMFRSQWCWSQWLVKPSLSEVQVGMPFSPLVGGRLNEVKSETSAALWDLIGSKKQEELLSLRQVETVSWKLQRPADQHCTTISRVMSGTLVWFVCSLCSICLLRAGWPSKKV